MTAKMQKKFNRFDGYTTAQLVNHSVRATCITYDFSWFQNFCVLFLNYNEKRV